VLSLPRQGQGGEDDRCHSDAVHAVCAAEAIPVQQGAPGFPIKKSVRFISKSTKQKTEKTVKNNVHVKWGTQMRVALGQEQVLAAFCFVFPRFNSQRKPTQKQQMVYDLVGAVCHSGTASGGHYRTVAVHDGLVTAFDDLQRPNGIVRQLKELQNQQNQSNEPCFCCCSLIKSASRRWIGRTPRSSRTCCCTARNHL
jgi:hypothetical protein